MRKFPQPDLISFSALSSQTVLSTSYQIISLFGHNTHTTTVPAVSSTGFGPAYWVAGKNEEEYIFKAATYNTTSPIPFNITFPSTVAGKTGKLTVLGAEDGHSANIIDGSEVVQTTQTELVASEGGVFGFELGQWEVAVLRV